LRTHQGEFGFNEEKRRTRLSTSGLLATLSNSAAPMCQGKKGKKKREKRERKGSLFATAIGVAEFAPLRYSPEEEKKGKGESRKKEKQDAVENIDRVN